MKIKSYLFSALFVLSSLVTLSQDGQWDTTFGNSGIVQTDLFGSSDIVFALALQNDGDILISGSSEVAQSDWDPVLVRYRSDGSLDDTFGINGIVVTDFSTGYLDKYHKVLVQNDQKILAAGDFGGSAKDYMIARYLPNGDLDPTFGTSGIVITDLGDEDRIGTIVILNDDKILLAGASFVNGSNKLTLIRFLPDGSLDPSFGTNGVLISEPTVPNNKDITIRLLDNDKILIGLTFGGIYQLRRYLPDGSLDLEFGSDGIVYTGNVSSGGGVFDLSPDGKIVVGTSFYSSDVAMAYLQRFLPNGSLDTSFGNNGEVFMSQMINLNRIIVQPNLKILVLGTEPLLPDSFILTIARYHASGSLDPSFGPGGDATYTSLTGKDFMLQEDGKIIWAGYEPFFGEDFFVGRYLNDPFTFGLEDNPITKADLAPNPTQNLITLNFDHFQDSVPYQITDLSGKLLKAGELTGNQMILDLSSFQSGLYLLNVSGSSYRIVKE
ncbi:MAG: T9SS type A sorting domain-containing protein [Bacteroidota bacterium]